MFNLLLDTVLGPVYCHLKYSTNTLLYGSESVVNDPELYLKLLSDTIEKYKSTIEWSHGTLVPLIINFFDLNKGAFFFLLAYNNHKLSPF